MSDRWRRTTGVWLAALACLLAGCSSGSSTGPAAARHSPSASPTSATSSAPPPPPAPVVGSCHRLTLDQATQPIDTTAAVPCTSAHTSVTVVVGRLSALEDGHLLAVDSTTVQQRIARTCPPTRLAYVGGSQVTQRLSRLEVVWFTPTPAQAGDGADWFRCDVVALAGSTGLASLPRRMRGVLDAAGALDRFGTCGTTAPGRPGFQRVICSLPHAWQAVDTVELPRRTRYLAAAAASQGDSSCKDVAAARANGALSYTWSFEWPTQVQWDAGQRYGYCWLPQK